MNPRHRRATRALVIDPQGNFLLFLSHFDPGSGLEPRWVFPGGGLEGEETPHQGILRELLEETGRSFRPEQVLDLGITIKHSMEDRRKHDTGEAYFFELHVSESFEPSKEFWTPEEHRDTVQHRWWSMPEVIAEKPWIGPDGAIDFLLERFNLSPDEPGLA